MTAARKALRFGISARFAKRLFLFGPWIFSALGLAVELAGKESGVPDWHGIVPLFSLSHEGNFPTLYQVGVLAAIAALLFVIARSRAQDGDRWGRQWLILALGFTYIAIDEFASIHELLNYVLDLQGVFFFGWVIPFGIAALLVAISFVPFLLALPRRLARHFVLAGTIYVAGAIGMELPLGWWTAENGMENIGYALLDWSEETLEMLGAGLFAASVFDVARACVARVEIDLPEPGQAGRPDPKT